MKYHVDDVRTRLPCGNSLVVIVESLVVGNKRHYYYYYENEFL